MRVRLPVLILVVLAIVYFAGHLFSSQAVVGFYTISHWIKGALVFVLPWVIFIFMASFLSEMENKAWSFVVILGGAILASNLLATFASFAIFSVMHPLVVTVCDPIHLAATMVVIKPAVDFPLSPILNNNTALLSGLSLGIILSFFSDKNPVSQALIALRARCIAWLRKLLLPIIPMLVFGFLLKLHRESNLDDLLAMYTKVFIVTFLSMVFYSIVLYFIAAQGRVQEAWRLLKAFFPAAMTAFAAMSSMAAYPVTLSSAEKVSSHPKTMQGIITSTVNIHLMGVGIAIPILAITVSMYFGNPFPSVSAYSIFAFYLTLAKFSVAAIPGGSIMVAVPVLQDYFGFTPEMSALIMSMYMLVDPFSTATNVLGNGAFATFMSRFVPGVRRVNKK